MLNESTSTSGETFQPVKIKFNFIARNDATIPLYNHSMLLGAIYELFAQVDPVFSYKQHKSTLVKPWSFSLLKFYEQTEKTNYEGYYRVNKGNKGYFFVKSINPYIKTLIQRFGEMEKIFHIGKLEAIVEKSQVETNNLHDVPDNLDTVVIRLETPTFFYNSRTKTEDSLSSETLLNYQSEKFKQLGIIDVDPEQLYPYFWFLNDYTEDSWGYITSNVDKSKVISFKGKVGRIKFKIVGTSFERAVIWKLLSLSEFTGIGTRTSMGFGHNSLESFTSQR